MDSPSVSNQTTVSAPEAQPARAGYFRWVICALLLLGTTKNYMDRQVIGLLKPTLQHDLGWDEIQYGHLVSIFQLAYALGMLLVGRLIDWLGTRLGYALAMVGWSLASMCHGLVSSFASFGVARFALGFGEAGVFPASLKATAEWFPRKERAFATGIFNAGTNIGAALTPLVVYPVAKYLGWRWAFFTVGALGFVWLVLWLIIYRKPEEHPSCSPAELAYIRSDPTPQVNKIGWLRLFPRRQTWAFAFGKLITDPVWWFYLFWIPDFLQKTHNLNLKQVILPILVIYVLADAGSVGGGWISSYFIKQGKTVNASRKAALLICALSAMPIVFVAQVTSTWGAVLLLGLATAAHQGFSANLFTLPSDMFPAKAVASVVGIGGMLGALGGMFSAEIVAHLLQWTHSYRIPFLVAGSTYVIALGVIHLLAPKLEPAQIAEK
jgi:MFS transporter, ACS family, hexuronate transporter